MGVYLPNMEMPEKCGLCKLCLDDSRICNGYCMFFHRRVNMMERDKNCPLVSVPPHGDLIDAQEEMRLMQSCDYDTYDDYNRAFDMLDNAPTIIPAEEGE